MENVNEISALIADVREQVLFMRELGVESFDVSLPEISNVRSEISNSKTESDRPAIPKIEIPKIEIPKPVDERPAGSMLASMPSLKDRLAPRKVVPPVEVIAETTTIPTPEIIVTDNLLTKIEMPGMPVSDETIEQIRAEIGPDCTRCKLSMLGRKNVVNSTGNFNAEMMFVGEAPGADEDEQGFQFVGRAGKLLTDIMGAIGFSRDDVFIGNINRCRPPGNRAPEPDETLACKPFLKREIAVVRPRVIVVLGATAAQNLLETKVPIGKLRGQFHDYLGTKVMPTFHPAYLLRDPHKKREVWEDMKLVRDFLKA